MQNFYQSAIEFLQDLPKILGKLVTYQLRYEIILILGLCLDLLSNLHDKTNNFS